MTQNKTIAAVSTPYGKGGIAVIRISGADALEIAGKCFLPAGKKTFSEIPGGSVVYGEIRDGNERIDDGVAAVFRAPRSFTGEDVVEISCHGGILNTQQVLGAVFAAGAEPATAGEFTRRAFMAGKLSLTEAEAVADVIDASTTGMLKLSRNAAGGKLSAKINELYDRMIELTASVYAIIDYPEEDLSDVSGEELRELLYEFSEDIDGLLCTYKAGRAISDGIETTICGRPNVGKSAVYNRLLGEDRAIVTDIAGTTRDLLYDRVALGDVTLNLCDTAGVRNAQDNIERIGIERAIERAKKSELVLFVFDGSIELSDEDTELIESIGISEDRCTIALINKSDLEVKIDKARIEQLFDNVIEISAKSGMGFDKLTATVTELYVGGNINVSDTPILYNARQYSAISRAKQSVDRAVSALDAGFSPDVASVDLESALSALGECDGRAVGEDIVSNIFSRFCVGK